MAGSFPRFIFISRNLYDKLGYLNFGGWRLLPAGQYRR
jgi:hypothetical protein